MIDADVFRFSVVQTQGEGYFKYTLGYEDKSFCFQSIQGLAFNCIGIF